MTKEKTFYQLFCEEYGINKKNNTIRLKEYNDHQHRSTEHDFEIFSEDKFGNIKILVYTLGRETILYDNAKANPDKPNINNARDLRYYVTRYKELKKYVNEKGEEKEKKYDFPKGAGTHPFFPPALLAKYEKKTKIPTLILTEGYKKAYYASLHGLDVVGLSSITHSKQKDTDAMYDDVLSIIRACDVKNIILLWDGDCLDISTKALEKGEDIYTRPAGFYNSALKVKELLKDYITEGLELYFAHVISESVEGSPKGLDDILISKKGEEKEVVSDILHFSKPGNYFFKTNISHSVTTLTKHFYFTPVESFYNFHQEKIKDKEFVFRGTKHKYDEKKQECIIIIPGAAKNYFRVGCTYYKFVNVPNKYNQIEKTFHKWLKEIISDDHGKKFLEHIAKYEAFCNVPDHINYLRTPHSCFNLYGEFEHLPNEGDCENSLAFVKHIFEEHYELGLDYLQLLYQKPTQILPILCLVSEENETGKSTFIKWLKALFTQNCTVIGNDDFANAFNAGWASKLIIACEESFIEKKPIMEKIKQLSTGDKIMMNAKGKDQVEIDFFGKFILGGNNETTFLIANRHDVRYWVRKIKKPVKDNVNLVNELIDEIPSFLYYLNNRQMSTKCESRMWFNKHLLETEALRALIAANKPKIERIIYSHIREMFISFGEKSLRLPYEYIHDTILGKRFEEPYIRERLKHMGFDRYKTPEGKYSNIIVKIPTLTYDGERQDLFKKCYPYIFNVEDFMKPEELEQYDLPEPTPEETFKQGNIF